MPQRLIGSCLVLLACASSAVTAQHDVVAPAGPPAGAAGTLIVLNKSGHDASFIDPASGETWLTLPTGEGPHEVAVSPDGQAAVVANYGTMKAGKFVHGSTLTVYDLRKGAVRSTIDLGTTPAPHGIQYLADGKHVVVTAEARREVLLVDVDAGRVVRSIPTESAASHMLVVTPDGARVFVANIGSGTVSVLDLQAGKLIKNIPTAAGCEGIDITPDGREVWTTNRAADTLSVIDTESLEVVASLRCAKFPIRIKLTPDGQRALVSNALSAEVVVFDVGARREIARIAMTSDIVDAAGERLFGDAMAGSTAPVGVLITPDGRRAFVANTNADVVSVIDLQRLVLVDTLRAGKEPDGLGWTHLARDS